MLKKLNVSNFSLTEYLDGKEIGMLEENMILRDLEQEAYETWGEYYNDISFEITE